MSEINKTHTPKSPSGNLGVLSEDAKYIITIGRQLGSGGKLLGELLSKKLNISCYDKELIQLASRESGLGKEFFEKADEKSSFSTMGQYFGFRSGYMGYNANNYLCNETLFKIQSDVIKELAKKESCIFVGRCADYILREHSHCLKIFISANCKDRVERMMQEHQITEKEAKMLIEQTDKKRATYYNYYSNKVWGMATTYDLCFNSSALEINEIASFIENYINKKFLVY
ncbi:cytidylate kinase [Bacteroidia bacterium]|nr:cytidylate kinase [Bacteroidia bacterium]GHT27606.1 cytidylate kinase [Bacteroidia bacterium]GHT85457.1 cytidylate kinase [Bacteroidia bacterium]